jgi:hypothetical protein
LESGVGYAMKRTGNSPDIPFTGTISGDIIVPVSSQWYRYGWNSLGNPYTSAIKIKDDTGFIMENLIPLENGYEAVYLWNALAGNYWVINLSGYYNGEWHLWYQFGTFEQEAYVQAGQGFLVNINWPAPSPCQVVFKRTMQYHSNITSLKKAVKSWPGITLIAKNGINEEGTIITFYEKGTTGLDKGYDAGLLSVKPFQLYTRLVEDSTNINMGIQTLPDNQYAQLRVPVGIELPAGGEVTFSASGVILPEGIYPVLEDKLLNTNIPLKSVTDTYSVIVPKNTTGTGRFYLHFGTTTDTKIVKQPEIKYSAWFKDRKIIILGTGAQEARAVVFDMNGRKLGEYRMLKENRNEIPVEGVANGVYLLQIWGKSGTQVIKVPVVYE